MIHCSQVSLEGGRFTCIPTTTGIPTLHKLGSGSGDIGLPSWRPTGRTFEHSDHRRKGVVVSRCGNHSNMNTIYFEAQR